MSDPSWALIESFVRVVEAGSLTGAARASGMSQPTLSRHISELEDTLGVRLFDRVPRGMQLTPQGAALWARAEVLGAQMDGFLRAATGLSERVAGTVRVSVSETMSALILPLWIGDLHAAHPQIEIEWVVDNRTTDLLGREADVAVRMIPPQQLDLVARRVGELPMGFFASRAFLARCGPISSDDHRAFRWVGSDRDGLFIRGAARMGFAFAREDFAFRSDSYLAQRDAICAGLGVGIMNLIEGAQDPQLVRLFDHLPLPALPAWVVAHQEVHTSARVRLVFDSLCEVIGATLTPPQSPALRAPLA